MPVIDTCQFDKIESSEQHDRCINYLDWLSDHDQTWSLEFIRVADMCQEYEDEIYGP